jgi:NADH:ubiquinone oxidoreductase subunit D
MRQAVRIIKQCVEKLRSAEGQGPVIVNDNKIVSPRRGAMKRSIEAMIEQFKLYAEGFRVPKGEFYAAVEAPKACERQCRGQHVRPVSAKLQGHCRCGRPDAQR